MEGHFSDFYEELSQLSHHLSEGLEQQWSHELRKQILLLLHKLKNDSRKLEKLTIESELLAIEVTLGYGSGSTKDPEISLIEDHQLRLLDLIESKDEIEDPTSDNEPVEEIKHEKNKAKPLFEIEEVELEEVEIEEVELEEVDPETSSARIQLVLCNCPGRDAARELANGLVKARLAACVNVIANIGAIYWWEGEIKDTAECQLQIKTSNQSLDDLTAFIKNNHPNDVPEIIIIPVHNGNEDYFEWVKQETYARE